jgi:hypothetical protein
MSRHLPGVPTRSVGRQMQFEAPAPQTDKI